MTSSSSPSQEDIAISKICSTTFHQSLWLPSTSTHPKLRVTYSATTNFTDVNLPSILFIGPMFSTRWHALQMDNLAQDTGVRVVCIDRPGFGGSTPVSINIRMAVWLETVPALLTHLNVKHVSIVTHSAGAVYTLNTLFHHRSILDPRAPYVAFLAPFVPTASSNAMLTTLLTKLPTSMLESFSGLNTFINNNVLPSTSWSGGIISSAAAALPKLPSFSSTSSNGAEAGATTSSSASASKSSTTTTPSERYGFDPETAKLIEKLSAKYQFAENTTGANEEVKLCLRRCEDRDWGVAADYEGCIRRIAENEAALAVSASTAAAAAAEGNSGPPQPEAETETEAEPAKLVVEAYFAGSDVMIAKRGQQFFEQCWQSEEVRDKVLFRTETFESADHDSLLVDYKKGALKIVFGRIAGLKDGES